MKPILFSTPMVQAILDGRKTMFREEISGGFLDEDEALLIAKLFQERKYEEAEKKFVFEAPNKVEDILYVQEEMTIDGDLDVWYVSDDEYVEAFIDDGTKPYPELNEEKYPEEYVGSVFAEDMPKECARIFLRVTNIRVERLQDIEIEDIENEGFDFITYEPKDKNKMYSADEHGSIDCYEDCVLEWWQNLWNSTSKEGYKWEANPYVFVYEFERVEKPKDNV